MRHSVCSSRKETLPRTRRSAIVLFGGSEWGEGRRGALEPLIRSITQRVSRRLWRRDSRRLCRYGVRFDGSDFGTCSARGDAPQIPATARGGGEPDNMWRTRQKRLGLERMAGPWWPLRGAFIKPPAMRVVLDFSEGRTVDASVTDWRARNHPVPPQFIAQDPEGRRRRGKRCLLPPRE
jgi:hypothetical protein